MRKYLCIKDYHPLIYDRPFKIGDFEWNMQRRQVPTPNPVIVKGDVMTQMDKDNGFGNVPRFKSKLDSDCALYEHTLIEYSDCFELIK